MNQKTNNNVLFVKIFLVFITVIILVGIDLWIKMIAKQNLENKGDLIFISGFWSFQYTENDDIGFSLLRLLNTFLSRSHKFILIITLQLTGTIIAIAFYFILNKWKHSLPLLLIICGGFGNLIDRIIRGYVVDYVKWRIGSFVWPIFNIADVYTVVGAFLFGAILIFFTEEIKKE